MYRVSSASPNAGPVLRRRRYRWASGVSMNIASRSLLLPFPYAPCMTWPSREVTRIGRRVELMAIKKLSVDDRFCNLLCGRLILWPPQRRHALSFPLSPLLLVVSLQLRGSAKELMESSQLDLWMSARLSQQMP